MEEMHQPTPTPCGLCLGVIHWIADSSGLDGLAQHQPEWHQDVGHLQISAQSCPLCSSMWDLSLSESYSSAISRLASGATLSSPPQLLLEVINVKKTERISWAVIHTTISVEELGRIYNCVDMIGISSQPELKGLNHPTFWRFSKADKERTLLEDRIATLKAWLQDCELNHEACHPVAKQYPTRILDVKVGGPLRIVARNQIQRDEHPVRYATLSHSWGNHMPIQTTMKTKPVFEKLIPEGLLPRTFQDAVIITQSLGIRYLWIDSLCIVQDDSEDWQREALGMKDTYSGSTINIAASDALDSTGGCFGQDVDVTDPMTDASLNPGHGVAIKNSRSAAKGPRVFVYQHKDQPRSTMIRFQAQTPRHLQSMTHLTTRGWVLQEELLSHRIVHCVRPEIYWQCRCSYKTQAGQIFDPLEVFSGELDFKLAPSRRKERIWYEWIEDYSKRDFTIPGDRIAAIVGITSHYQQTTGYSPLLGLWRESFARGLLWLRIGPIKGPGFLDMPSWTWLSCNGPVIFDFWGRSFREGYTIEDHVSLCTSNITWTGLARVSSVQSTILVIRGPLKDLCFRIAPGHLFNPPYFHLEGEELDSSEPIPWSCSGQFDDETVPREGFITYTCLLVRSSSHEQLKSHIDTFLILEMVASSSDDTTKNIPSFRRIGIASIQGKKRPFRSAEEKELRLC